MLPEEVLREAQDSMLSYAGSGMSVMEMSHRSPLYQAIIDEAQELLRSLMKIPEDYSILFLQGGASLQFSMVPLNLLKKGGKADYVVTGQWGKKAYEEGCRFGDCRAVASSADKTFSYIPELTPEMFDADADYVHICYNNTIYGTKYAELPPCGSLPLVADLSSCILSEELDVSKFALIYAGAQKNMGPAGLTTVVLKKELLGRHREETPIMLQYEIHDKNGSMYNTPPTYSIYVCMLVLRWLKKLGGIPAMEQINREKAALLYDYLDNSRLFKPTVQAPYRSLMNIPFVTGDKELDAAFVKDAASHGLVNLKGHRTVGGMRASIYNAMPLEGVQALIERMKAFEAEH